ncbi:Transient receptor potential cation channel subfamily V member 2 like [Actinidia chinensis var. chinensis]|uniref:Transient receptor potential cation channel subfamily V member 2 like n=1 Tax=Actinidia chinensis var. chinensis TaxID=1590841 RepID=A0A2R6QH77_ACTCC|nr:Transient receptor potential cation channel subfamily V member 2 like [Actinidia chinensis var. chinensis]
MPEVLQFKMLPRWNVWTQIFQEDRPDECDIGLYFFLSNTQRSGSYVVLLEFIETRDLMMRTYIGSVELFIFTCKLVSAHAQRWKEKHFLWGIFCPDKNYKAKCKLNEKLSLLHQLLDSAKHDDANDDDGIVHMDMDLLAGQDVGRVDRAIFSRESSAGSCGSSKEEIPNAISLNR